MIEFILEPLQYEFIQRALLAAFFVGLTSALLGVYVVLRRMSNIGHALTHSALPGIVIAYLNQAPVILGALMATVLTGLGIGMMTKERKVYEDTAIGMMPTAMFALGILLISHTRSYRDMSTMLFGNILSVTNQDLCFIGAVTMIIIVMLLLFRKELILYCVDPNYAKTIGMPIGWVKHGLLLLLSLTVVIGIQAVGTLLTSALLIIPVATVRLFTDSLKAIVWLSAMLAVVTCIAGVYCSYYAGVSSGAAIVLLNVTFFIIGLLYRRLKMC